MNRNDPITEVDRAVIEVASRIFAALLMRHDRMQDRMQDTVDESIELAAELVHKVVSG